MVSFQETKSLSKSSRQYNVEHNLHLVRVCSIDTPDNKVFCKAQCMYGLQMIDKDNNSRKIFFTSHQKMLDAVDTLIKAQQTTRLK